MNKKILSRKRRARATRAKIATLGVVRLSVHRSLKHTYVQVIDPSGVVLAAASTREQSILADCHQKGGNVCAAKVVGKAIAERAIQANITQVAFDRSGWKYHGRIKALADAAREAGLNF